MPSPSRSNPSARVGVAFGGVRVGINGFGRIGRLFFRAAEALSSSIDVVAINDPALESVDYAAYLLRRDSTYGRFPGIVEVETVDDGTKVLRVDGRRVPRGAPRSPRILPQAPAPADQPPVEPVGYPKAFEGFPDEIAANKAFATGLIALQQKIMERNKARHAGDGVPPALARAYNCFDVNFVESSIAI